MTGNHMQGGQLFAHQRLELAKGVPENFRSFARALRDTGVTGFIHNQMRRGNEPAYGERNRSDAATKWIRVRSKPEKIR